MPEVNVTTDADTDDADSIAIAFFTLKRQSEDQNNRLNIKANLAYIFKINFFFFLKELNVADALLTPYMYVSVLDWPTPRNFVSCFVAQSD